MLDHIKIAVAGLLLLAGLVGFYYFSAWPLVARVGMVLAGIAAALRAGLKPVKLNMVVLRATLDRIDELIDYVGRGEGLRLQLIQYMPELTGHRDWMVDIDAVKAHLAARAERVLVRDMHHRRIYCIHGAEVEVVDPVNNSEFCFNCRRIRVTHDGKLKGCLNRSDDLVPARGLSDEGLCEAFRAVVQARVPYYGVYVAEGAAARPASPVRGTA